MTASTGTALPEGVADRLRAELPTVAEHTVAAIVVEVPSYAHAFSGEMGRTIETAVQQSLGGFLELAVTSGTADASTPIDPALEGAYALGRGEARDGRSIDALLAAYRVGARVAWRELSAAAVQAGLTVEVMARFAELVFAYIDRLSAASVAGHTDELASTDRARQRLLERLALLLVTGAPADELAAAAERASWTPPRSLTAVLLPAARVRGALLLQDERTLQLGEDVPGLPEDRALLLVPDSGGNARAGLLRSLEGRGAVVGPARPWQEVAASCARALRAAQLAGRDDAGTVDTDRMLPELVLHADEDALADLRSQVLAPLAELPEATQEKLTETLRCWLLHHGRRERVAAELFVHPQTVRYRMGQLRDLYGDRLEDPATVLALTVALGSAG